MKKIALLTLVLGTLMAIQATTAGSAQTSAAKRVEVVNFAFKPGSLTVAKGTTVEFENESGTTHTATRNGGGFSKRLAPGASIPVRFNQRGSFPYHCRIHPSMKGKIVVQ